MNDSNSPSKSGIYILLILFAGLSSIILALAKISGVLDISLWVVFSPLLFVYIVIILAFAIVIGVSKWKEKH